MRLLLILTLTLLTTSNARADLSTTQQNQLYEWLSSPQSDIRRQAHQFLSQLQDADETLHESILKKARAHHSKSFASTLEQTYTKLDTFAESHRDWTYHCNQALELGRQDLAYDSSDLKKLAQLLKAASREYRKLQSLTLAAEKLVTALEPTANILLEFDMELAMLRNDDDAFDLSLDDVYQSAPFGNTVRNRAELIAQVRALAKTMADVEAYNSNEASWPTTPQRTFAQAINAMRVELGLTSLYLQKELSEGSASHSAEMAKLGYFAHESPTPANRTPALRATNANYPGSWQGENIYMGSSSPQAAYDAWWKSDGHRKIMLMDGPNHLGIALVQKHWTLSMGRGDAPETLTRDHSSVRTNQP